MSGVHRLTAWLEQCLGDPRDHRRALSVARSTACDRAEEFPDEAARELDGLGLPRWFAPAGYGGALRGMDELLGIVRALARRDLTVVVGCATTYLAAAGVWLAGRPDQVARLSGRVCAGAVVGLAVTEGEPGSDLPIGELTVRQLPGGGYRLDGEMRLVNNANRSAFLCVLARTVPVGGPGAFTLLCVDKERLVPRSWRTLPAERTVGVRGADLSGIVFDGAELPDEARIGAWGEGLESVLKGRQLARTLCAGMSLGALDQALRLVLEFAHRHQLHGRRLVELPQVTRTLAEVYAELLLVEAVGLVATRSAHTLPQEQSVASAAVKFLVPTMADRSLGALRQLLGGRALLTRDHADGQFQKIERDHRAVGLFGGSPVVGLVALIRQFPVLARRYREGHNDPAGVAAAARLDAPLPPLGAVPLSLQSRTGSSIVQSLPGAAERIRALAGAGEVRGEIADRTDSLVRLCDGLHDELAAHRPAPRGIPDDAFGLARRYSLLYAAAASLQLWLHNRPAGDAPATAPPWADDGWLEAALARLERELSGQPDPDDLDGPAFDRLLPALEEQRITCRLFSLFPCVLAESRPPSGGARSYGEPV